MPHKDLAPDVALPATLVLSDSRQRVADYLAGHPQVEAVRFAGLADSPWHERAQKYLPRGAGSIISSTAGLILKQVPLIYPGSDHCILLQCSRLPVTL